MPVNEPAASPAARMMQKVDCPLRWHTPESWAPAQLREPCALLNDHAHLEKKAASNALSLVAHWPSDRHLGGVAPEGWVHGLTTIANDETEHLRLVLRLLDKRGGSLSKGHSNPYAADLRALVRAGQGKLETADRLMVSALIELRSCERFACLAAELESSAGADPELLRLYKGLWAAEHGHFHAFLELALELPGADRAEQDARWAWMLGQEAQIISKQNFYIGMHAGVKN